MDGNVILICLLIAFVFGFAGYCVGFNHGVDAATAEQQR